MNVGELYRFKDVEDIDGPFKNGMALMVIDIRQTYVATLIDDQVYYWEYEYLHKLIEKL
jgi:hypothetical protein